MVVHGGAGECGRDACGASRVAAGTGRVGTVVLTDVMVLRLFRGDSIAVRLYRNPI